MRRKLTSHTIRFVFAAGAMAVLCCASNSAAQDRAEERSDVPIRAAAKLYGGDTLEVWKRRLDELKPTSEYAAVLAPGLLEIVEDRQAPDAFRERAALTLGRIGKPAAAAVPVLGEILVDPNEPLRNRIWAGRALGYFGKYASPAADALIDFLFDEQIPPQYRAVPVEALGLMGSRHPNVIPAVLQLFQCTPGEQSGLSPRDATHLRELAVEAFSMMGPDAAIAAPLLMRAVRDPSEVESIRRGAVVALGRIGADAAIAIPVLIESLEFDPSEAIRDEAARALAKIGDRAHVVLQGYLAHPDPAVRWRIASAFGELKSPPLNLVVALQNMASDPDEVVRLAALESLSKLETDPDKFLAAAIQLLASEDRQVRMRAMRLIVAHFPLQTSDVAALEELQHHDRPATARIARLVIKKLNDTNSE